MFAPSALIKVMIDAARKAARGLVRDFGEVAELQVSKKGPADFVSAADIKAEQVLFEALTAARPGYGFLGEERGLIEGTDKTHTWIVDPLDGTTNFLHAIPHFAINIALEREGQIVGGGDLQPDHQRAVSGPRRGRAPSSTTSACGWPRAATWARRVLATGIPFMGRPGHGPFLKELHQIDPAGLGRAPVRLGGAGPGLGRGRPLRRLLGARPGRLGRGGGHAAGDRGRRRGHRTPTAARRRSTTGTICVANSELHPLILGRLKAAG